MAIKEISMRLTFSALLMSSVILTNWNAHAASPGVQVGDFKERKALVADLCPHLKIASFSFGRYWDGRGYGGRFAFKEDYKYKNVGSQPIVAFEIVFLQYDPFNRLSFSGFSLIPGTNSADYKPLPPGAEGSDANLHSDRHVLTEIAYVRSVRLADGTIWRAQSTDVLEAVKGLAPDIKDPGTVDPKPNGEARSDNKP